MADALSQFIIVPLLIALAATQANAGATEEAEAHVKRGIQLRRSGDDQSALSEFRAAYAAARTPRTAAQLGICEQALGRWADAEGHLIEAVSAKDDPWIKKNQAVLENSLAIIKNNVARLEVVGSPAGAEVSLAGQVIGRLPMSKPVAVNVGTIDIEVSATGRRTATRSLTLKAGEYQRILIRLEEGPVATGATPGEPKSEVATETRMDLTGEATKAPVSQPIYKRPWLWVATGVVVAAAVAAIFISASGGQDYLDVGTRRSVN